MSGDEDDWLDGVLWRTHNEGVPFCVEETIAGGEEASGSPWVAYAGGRGCLLLVSGLAERIIV